MDIVAVFGLQLGSQFRPAVGVQFLEMTFVLGVENPDPTTELHDKVGDKALQASGTGIGNQINDIPP